MADEKLEDTLVSMFCRRVAEDGDKPALHVKRGQKFEALTWNTIADDVRRTAAALVKLGVKPGDRVIQISENRYEWIVLDLAIHYARGISVAVHSTLTGPQIAYQINDSGAKLIAISGPDQARKLAGVAGQLPADLRYISFDACGEKIGSHAVTRLAEVQAQVSQSEGKAIEKLALESGRPTDLATILYTSGTTGDPKGVMLSHRNLTCNSHSVMESFKLEPGDLRLNWLPLSHIFARTSDYYIWIAGGGELGLAQSRETIIADCQALHPTYLNGVPYFFDKIYRYLHDQGLADTPGALQGMLGGRLKLCCGGGAALPDHVAEFFDRNGVVLVQGYGLTESSPVISTGTLEEYRLGTVGKPIHGVEVKIADDGEILTRGPHVMVGYWNLPQATAETIRDGWLHTGDLGRLEDGYLRITGRKKELIVTAGGKNIAPSYLEGLLTEDPLIAQAVVIGDAKNYLTALIVPDPDALRAEISRRQIALASPAEALSHPEVYAEYTERIRARLAGVSHGEQVRKFTLLSRGFTVESGELTPTLKVRRSIVLNNYAAEIRAMYGE
ncbi:MAG: long-chain fatty acid--CoA ligase [Planctomycetia bacterium]|nr:long-chain fatty acid--CoA ligase [Planctomycetia bacterium]